MTIQHLTALCLPSRVPARLTQPLPVLIFRLMELLMSTSPAVLLPPDVPLPTRMVTLPVRAILPEQTPVRSDISREMVARLHLPTSLMIFCSAQPQQILPNSPLSMSQVAHRLPQSQHKTEQVRQSFSAETGQSKQPG